MIEVGDFISFDGGLICGTVTVIEDGFVTIDEESGFTVTRSIDQVD